MILERRDGQVEGTSDNEASSLLLRYVRRPRPLFRLEGFGRGDVFLQFAMLLCLVCGASDETEPN